MLNLVAKKSDLIKEILALQRLEDKVCPIRLPKSREIFVNSFQQIISEAQGRPVFMKEHEAAGLYDDDNLSLVGFLSKP